MLTSERISANYYETHISPALTLIVYFTWEVLPMCSPYSSSVALARTYRVAFARILISSRALREAARAAASSSSYSSGGYIHARNISGEQSTRGTRSKWVSSCSPSVLLRPRGEKRHVANRRRKREVSRERKSVVSYLDLPTR